MKQAAEVSFEPMAIDHVSLLDAHWVVTTYHFCRDHDLFSLTLFLGVETRQRAMTRYKPRVFLSFFLCSLTLVCVAAGLQVFLRHNFKEEHEAKESKQSIPFFSSNAAPQHVLF